VGPIAYLDVVAKGKLPYMHLPGIEPLKHREDVQCTENYL